MVDRRIQTGTTDSFDSAPAGSDFSVDPALPSWITRELIAETIRVWQPYYATRLTAEDAVTVIQGVGQLFLLCQTKGGVGSRGIYCSNERNSDASG